MRKYEQQILDMIAQSYAHLTAEEIFLQLKQQEPRVVLATVYNTLNALYGAGKINKVSVAGLPDRYDRITKHDHLVCKKCGRLSDKSFADFTQTLTEQLGADIMGYDLKVFYLCPACRET